jgi:regulator of sirC expression with transglutaminase-like and TPR domain
MAMRTGEQAWTRMSRAETSTADLAEGALLVAAHEYPELDIDACLQQLQDMADTLRKRLRPDISPSEMLIALNHYLFDELRFRGNAAEYYDPRNSYLNDVMERRLGIPISLSVLYISADELRRMLGEETQAASQSAPALLHSMLRTASVPEILARMLRNLKAIYLQHTDLAKALWAADRIVTLLPSAAVEYRERGLIYLELECFRAALTDLKSYASLAPQAAQAEGIAATIADLQQRAARLN